MTVQLEETETNLVESDIKIHKLSLDGSSMSQKLNENIK